jgi:hypothetical protein
MESQAFKIFLAFIAIMAGAFIVIGANKDTPQEKIQGAFLQTSSLLSSLALGKCTEAAKKETGATPYTPSESDSDHSTFVRLIWKNIGTAKEVECRYVMDQGITLLRIDDRTPIKRDAAAVTSSGGAPAHQSGH